MKSITFLLACLCVISCGSSSSSSDSKTTVADTARKANPVVNDVSQREATYNLTQVKEKPAPVDHIEKREDAVKPQPKQTPWVVGNWKWVKTTCCGRKQNTTIPDANHWVQLTFNADGSYERKQSSTTTDGKYTLGKFSDYDSRSALRLDNGDLALLQGGNDSLVLNYGYMDKQIEWYVRTK